MEILHWFCWGKRPLSQSGIRTLWIVHGSGAFCHSPLSLLLLLLLLMGLRRLHLPMVLPLKQMMIPISLKFLSCDHQLRLRNGQHLRDLRPSIQTLNVPRAPHLHTTHEDVHTIHGSGCNHRLRIERNATRLHELNHSSHHLIHIIGSLLGLGRLRLYLGLLPCLGHLIVLHRIHGLDPSVHQGPRLALRDGHSIRLCLLQLSHFGCFIHPLGIRVLWVMVVRVSRAVDASVEGRSACLACAVR